ncbi:hypothetical protein [Cytobacillus oceanisediminis]|uniref:hypothetical protein n=1 Tax=Cytobacillus oceanisediminis TaxID=665099 RepID=UPI001C24500A|nr:hypothetical protein [Cytobacillus oceanisediminis]MBU8768271.1 hypothetical protein [Cytobacillus oceanisediminis]
MADFPTNSFEDIFLQYITDVSKEYVKEEIISEKQREKIINYHQKQIERDRKIRNEISEL